MNDFQNKILSLFEILAFLANKTSGFNQFLSLITANYLQPLGRLASTMAARWFNDGTSIFARALSVSYRNRIRFSLNYLPRVRVFARSALRIPAENHRLRLRYQTLWRSIDTSSRGLAKAIAKRTSKRKYSSRFDGVLKLPNAKQSCVLHLNEANF